MKRRDFLRAAAFAAAALSAPYIPARSELLVQIAASDVYADSDVAIAWMDDQRKILAWGWAKSDPASGNRIVLYDLDAMVDIAGHPTTMAFANKDGLICSVSCGPADSNPDFDMDFGTLVRGDIIRVVQLFVDLNSRRLSIV